MSKPTITRRGKDNLDRILLALELLLYEEVPASFRRRPRQVERPAA